ncbi:J domain-containing protein [Pseudomonas sp. D2-3]
MNPWTLLGLNADADTRSIKRRYAQLLKQHRPDEDAEAFQRLREAYEQALAHAASEDQRRDTGAEQWQAPASVAQDEPVMAAATEEPAQARIEQLLQASASLDAALQQAREQGQEADLQRYLLTRCATLDEEGLRILRWGMQRLQWLSPWQADNLPRTHSDALAARLLALELETLQQRLQAGEERAVVDAAAALLASDWLQSFDRRRQLHDGMLWMLEVTEHWSGGLFERLCRLFGWNEDTGELPCSVERWNWLCWRCERHAAGQRVQQYLQLDWPLRVEERAAWLLLKPMEEREARVLVDHFDDQDWQAARGWTSCLPSVTPSWRNCPACRSMKIGGAGSHANGQCRPRSTPGSCCSPPCSPPRCKMGTWRCTLNARAVISAWPSRTCSSAPGWSPGW